MDTALHSGKDFAVSPFDVQRASPKISKTRLCSHLFCLLEANDRRYLLPSQSCPPQVVARLRIPNLTRDNSSLRSEHSILQLPMAGKIGECSDFPLPILSTASGYKIEYPEFYRRAPRLCSGCSILYSASGGQNWQLLLNAL